MNHRTIASLAALIVLMHAVPLAARPNEPGTTAPAPLSGPSVPDEAGKPRVQRDFEGNMKPLDVRPEVAALDELTLSDAERAKVDAVLTRRAATMQRIIRENIDLLLRAQAVREGNDPKAKRELADDFREAFKELTADGPLAEQLAGAMSAENAEKFTSINKEYWRELMGQDAGKGERPQQQLRRVATRLLMQEVRRSYEGMVGDGKERLEQVIAELQLTPEQEGKVRAIVTEFGQKTKLNPNPRQRGELFANIARELTPEQRKRAYEMLSER